MHMKLASTQVATMRSFVAGIQTLFKVVIISKVFRFSEFALIFEIHTASSGTNVPSMRRFYICWCSIQRESAASRVPYRLKKKRAHVRVNKFHHGSVHLIPGWCDSHIFRYFFSFQLVQEILLLAWHRSREQRNHETWSSRTCPTCDFPNTCSSHKRLLAGVRSWYVREV